MIKRLLVVLIVSLCILSVSLHFVVEGLGGDHDHFIGHHTPGMIENHEGDQFIPSECGPSDTTQMASHVLVASALNPISRPLPPPFHPPKSL